jgi:eukaryotic-like serine/threonine-protein kinase
MSTDAPKVRSMFLDAVENHSPQDWPAFMEQACAGDIQLAQRLKELLQAHAKPSALVDELVPQRPLTSTEFLGEKIGTFIGSYKLLEQIGEGGMGLVFVAEQTQPIRRKVALKVIKPGMDTRQVIARFEAERQTLAMMDHPNIAKVLDAGMTDAGRPYFVMELVHGVPITDYCDQARFTVRQRLEVFLQVCRAVQHAHTKGIIHRDLKPNNVLVTSHDGVAVPMVIDFGVAKAMGPQLTEQTIHTGIAQMIGTPLYMSPEQAEFNQIGVDTRSDIYSLGVLLYELLTGATPFDQERLRTVKFDELRRILCDEEPRRPSERLSTVGGDLSTTSERRGVDPRELTRTLRGELDWIVMKAVEKDRERRYESASAFAADVQRYLNNEAVEACPPSTGYRVRKYVWRNRRALVGAGIVAVALVAATAVSTWQAVRARDAQHEAEADRDRAATAERRANTEAALARALDDFIQKDLLQQVSLSAQRDEGFEPARNLTVKEALDRAAGRIGRRFESQPLVEAKIRMTIANTYASVGERQLAVPHVERALALRETHLGLNDPDTINAMRRLAELCREVGRFADAITLHKQILQNRKARLGPDDPETLLRMSDLAASYGYDGQWGMSVPLFKQALEKQQAICGPAHPDTLRTMQGLAQTYTHISQFHESVALHEKILKLRNSTDEPSWWFLTTYAIACQGAGKLDHAGILFHKALAQQRERDDSGGVETANTLGWLARNLLLQERFAEAEPIAREAIAVYEKERPKDPTRFYFVSILGAVLCGQKSYDQAEPLLLQGYEGMKQQETLLLAIWKRRMGETGERVVHFYEVTNQLEKARAWRERLLEEKNKK